MNNKILFTICLLLPLKAAAQVVSLDECIRLAQQNNKQIRSRQAQTQAATYTMRSQKALFLPDISLSGNGLWNSKKGDLLNVPEAFLPAFDLATGTPAPTTMGAYFPGLNLDYKVGAIWQGGINVTQPIYMGGKISTAYRMAQLAERMSATQETQTRQEVWVEVATAYTGLVRAQEMQQVAQQYNVLLTELLQNVQAAVRHGMKLRNDELKVQVRLNESELQMHRADNARRLAAKNLCQVIGVAYNDSIKANATLPQTGDASQADLTGRPEVQLLDQQVEMARRQVSLARAELLPQVGMQGSYGYLHGLKINGDTKLDGGSFNVLLNVTIPVFHFGERANKVKAAKARLAQSELDRQHLNEKMQLELSQAIDNLDEARLEVTLAGRSLDQADENRLLSRKQYEAGMETLSDHLEAQALWQQAYASQVDAHCQLYLSYIKYLKAAGRLTVE